MWPLQAKSGTRFHLCSVGSTITTPSSCNWAHKGQKGLFSSLAGFSWCSWTLPLCKQSYPNGSISCCSHSYRTYLKNRQEKYTNTCTLSRVELYVFLMAVDPRQLWNAGDLSNQSVFSLCASWPTAACFFHTSRCCLSTTVLYMFHWQNFRTVEMQLLK